MTHTYHWTLTDKKGAPLTVAFDSIQAPVISDFNFYPSVDVDGLTSLKKDLEKYAQDRGLKDVEVTSYSAHFNRYALEIHNVDPRHRFVVSEVAIAPHTGSKIEITPLFVGNTFPAMAKDTLTAAFKRSYTVVQKRECLSELLADISAGTQSLHQSVDYKDIITKSSASMLNDLRSTAMNHINEVADQKDTETAKKQARKDITRRVIQRLNPKTYFAGPR